MLIRGKTKETLQRLSGWAEEPRFEAQVLDILKFVENLQLRLEHLFCVTRGLMLDRNKQLQEEIQRVRVQMRFMAYEPDYMVQMALYQAHVESVEEADALLRDLERAFLLALYTLLQELETVMGHYNLFPHVHESRFREDMGYFVEEVVNLQDEVWEDLKNLAVLGAPLPPGSAAAWDDFGEITFYN